MRWAQPSPYKAAPFGVFLFGAVILFALDINGEKVENALDINKPKALISETKKGVGIRAESAPIKQNKKSCCFLLRVMV